MFNPNLYPPAKLAIIIDQFSFNFVVEITILALVIGTLLLPKLFPSQKIITRFSSHFVFIVIIGLIIEQSLFARGNVFTIPRSQLILPAPTLERNFDRYLSTSDNLAFIGPQTYWNHLRTRQPFGTDLTHQEVIDYTRLNQELSMVPGNLNVLTGLYNASGYSAVILNSYASYLGTTAVNYVNLADFTDPKLTNLGVNYLISGYPDDFLTNTPGFTRLSQHPAIYKRLTPTPRFQLPSTTDRGRIISDSGSELHIETTTVADGQLILYDSFYPGWTATIDNQPVDITSVAGAFRGVYLSKGQHRIVFSFQSDSVTIGASLSLMALITFIILVLWPRLKLPSLS